MVKDKKKELIGIALLVAATLIWGGSFFLLKTTIESLPTFFVLALRFSVGAVMVGLVFIKRLIKFKLKALWQGSVIGLFLAAAYTLQTLGLKGTTPGKNAFLTASYVVIVPFIVWILFKNRPKWNNIVAAVLCVAGVGLVSLTGSFHVEQGDILSLLCGIFYAGQFITISRFTKESDGGQLLFTELLTVAVIFWIVSFASEKMPTSIGTDMIFPLVYLAVLATGAGQLFQLFGQKHVSVNSVSIIMSLEAVFGALFSVIFYGERPSAQVLAGFAVMFVAVLISELDWKEIGDKIKAKKEAKEEKGEEEPPSENTDILYKDRDEQKQD